MCLYAVTDSTWLKGRKLADVVEETIIGGTTFIQIREKKLSYEKFVELAKEVKKVTDRYHVPFVVNDEVEIAKKIDADGVHIGQSDKGLIEARNILGPDKIIGVSAHTVEEAIQAEKNGADYLGVGSVFTTSTKLDATSITLDMVHEICEQVSIPVVAIGGVQSNNIMNLKNSGVDGVAVISAIFAQENIKRASENLYSLSREMIE